MHISTGSTATSTAGLLLKNTIPVVAVLLLLFFLGAVIFGACLNFSPVPMEDSWHGMVDFYVDSLTSPLAWWEQHNEHRIVFAKLLFWLDMHYLAGSGLLLIPMNIILLLSTWWLLSCYANRLIGFSSQREKIQVWALLGLLCLAWIQNKNIISSFQSEFILVFLWPLLSFYCFARSLEPGSNPLRWRALSLFLGVSSAYCMVNGIFVLPVLAALSWYSERSPRRALCILACAAVSLAIFLLGYKLSVAGPAVVATVQAKPWYVLAFVLAYLGGPWYPVFGRLDLAIAFGGLAVALATYLFSTRSVYRSKPFALALLAYIAYVFATAGMTAAGRALALNLATTSRYMTPTLIMWAALLILLLARSRHVARWSGVAVVVVAALLLPTQMRAFRIDPDLLTYTPQTREVAALSLQLDIHDPTAKKRIILFYDELSEEIFQRARKHKVAIFSEKYAYPANQIGRRLQEVGGESCVGQITYRQLVDENRAAYRLGGTLAPDFANAFRYIFFSDAQGLVNGIAIPGRDFGGPKGAAATLRFDGYIFAQADFSEMRCIR